jgi:hypothetical protein
MEEIRKADSFYNLKELKELNGQILNETKRMIHLFSYPKIMLA